MVQNSHNSRRVVYNRDTVGLVTLIFSKVMQCFSVSSFYVDVKVVMPNLCAYQ